MARPYDRRTIADLYDGVLPWERVRAIMSSFKDTDRLKTLLEILQERVSWSEPILLPLAPHLSIVLRDDGERVVKCDCGREFGDYQANWKLTAVVRVRDTNEALAELYPQLMAADPEWMVLREFFCPGCATLLEVEAVPPGYPIVHDFEPDLDGLYEWLGKSLPPRP